VSKGESPQRDPLPLVTPPLQTYFPGSFGRAACAYNWLMSQTVSLSTRVSPQVRDRLTAEAAERGVPLATYTRGLLSVPAPGQDASSPGDGEVVNEVDCLFYDLPPEAGIHRAVCRALARTVQAGGAAGVSAGKELLDLTNWVRRRFEPEDLDEDEGV
jgi:hypothetical protein